LLGKRPGERVVQVAPKVVTEPEPETETTPTIGEDGPEIIPD
jgi:hypothetical protein